MILETKRLFIRKFKPTDLASLTDMFTDQEVMKYIGPRRAMTENEIQHWLLEILSKQDLELTRYTAALRTNDELIGVAGLRDENGIKDFGYYFRRLYWGKGYASEACSVLLHHIENDLNIKDYQIFIADENINSIRMMEKLSLRPVETVTRSGEQGHLYQRISWNEF